MAKFKVRYGSGVNYSVDHIETGSKWGTTQNLGLEIYEIGYDQDGYLVVGADSANGSATKIKAGIADYAIELDLDNAAASTLVRNDAGNDGGTYPKMKGNMTWDGVGNIDLNGGTLTGTATKAKYADVAEKYESDAQYPVGTVLMFGIETEATISDGSRPLMGVVSEKPALLMNSDLDTEHTATVALKGRIPVKCSVVAKRGDIIVVDKYKPGFAMVKPLVMIGESQVIGVALSDSIDGIVEVKV